MINYFNLIILITVMAFNCSEKIINTEITSESSEPIITIENPKSGKVVSEIVYIKAKTKNKDGILGVDFIINDSLFFKDTSRPYRYGWNTIQYLNNTEQNIKVILYNVNNDTIESEPITLIVDNSTALPDAINIISVTYDTTQVIDNLVEMTILWNSSKSTDFNNYNLLHSETQNGIKDSIFYSTNNLDTIFSTREYKPNIEHWFWILVTDTVGLQNIGNGKPNKTKTIPPDTSFLNPIIFENGFQISWTKCNNHDFNLYRLLQSNSETMDNKIIIAEFEDSLETSYIIQEQELKYYQIETENIWGLVSHSNIRASDYIISIGSDTFSVLNTINLSEINLNPITDIPIQIGDLINLQWIDLSSYQLSGEIPSTIKNLTKLEYLNLSHNQLSENIPTEIKNLTKLEYLNLSHNQLSGEIPPEIWELNKLERLIINNNNFIGELNPEIENLINARVLNFQENLLSGIIPDEICFFYNKNIFVNLRYNHLCPPYPECSLINEYFIFEQDTTNCN